MKRSPFVLDESDSANNKKANNATNSYTSQYERLQSLLWEKFDDAFTNALPSEEIKDMPSKYKYPLGCSILLVLVGIFVALFTTAYQDSINSTYLSPLVGDKAQKHCELIPVANSGVFLATKSGIWQGSSGFEFADAAYSATVTSWTVTFDEYKFYMDQLYVAIVSIGEQMKGQNLAINLLYWFSMAALPIAGNNAQRFYLSGDASVVFDRQHITGATSSIHGVCDSQSISGFDPSKSTLYVQYNHEQYVNNPACNNAVTPESFGYIPGVNSDIFQIAIDVRSLSTSMAVNFGILNFSDIVEITALRAPYLFNGTNITTSEYYDPKYPGMEPISCLVTANRQLCALHMGGTVYAIPIFNHKGTNDNLPDPCVCGNLTPTQLYECNRFKFLAGIIFWQSPLPDDIFTIMAMYDFQYDAINDAAFNASFISSYWGQQSTQTAALNSNASLLDAFQFCKLANDNYCSLLVFSAFDLIATNQAVSKYYYQLAAGSCADTISTPYENWYKLIISPFSPLTQEYEKCHYSSSTVFFTQLGVSVGNLSAITPFCVVVFIGLIGLYQYFAGIQIPAISYSKTEKEDALNAFAVSLLVARDKYFRQQSIINKYEIMREGPIIDNNRLSTISKVEKVDMGQFGAHMFTEIDTTMLSLVLQLEKQGIELDPTATQNTKSGVEIDNPMVVANGLELQILEQGPLEELPSDHNKPLLLLLNTTKQPFEAQPTTTLSTMSAKRPMVMTTVTELQSYSSLMTFISRLSYQLLHLMEEKQKNVAHRITTEQEYWQVVEQTTLFHQITFINIEKMVHDNGERLLFQCLLSLMEVHACLAFDCERKDVSSLYGTSCGYKFLDQTLSYSSIKAFANPTSS